MQPSEDRAIFLIRLLSDPKSSASAIGNAVDELGDLGDPRAIIPLTQFLDCYDWVIEAGSEYEGPLYASVIVALEKMGEPAIDILIDIFLNTSDKAKSTHAGTALLGNRAVHHNDHVVDRLEPYLDSLDSSLRLEIVRILGTVGTHRVITHIVKKLNDADTDVRIWAAIQVKKMNIKEAIKPLLYNLEFDQERKVREHAAGALARIGDSEVIPILNNMLLRVQEDVSIRQAIRWAIDELKAKAKFP
jgi:HEAT repeat protein